MRDDQPDTGESREDIVTTASLRAQAEIWRMTADSWRSLAVTGWALCAILGGLLAIIILGALR